MLLFFSFTFNLIIFFCFIYCFGVLNCILRMYDNTKTNTTSNSSTTNNNNRLIIAMMFEKNELLSHLILNY